MCWERWIEAEQGAEPKTRIQPAMPALAKRLEDLHRSNPLSAMPAAEAVFESLAVEAVA